jgi:tRNA dimethylallyltransferase
VETGSISVIAIVGPTAVGKTALSLELAEEFRGEIVSADSRQVYRGMDIGTAKPSPDEQRRVRHHMIDVVSPGESFTVSEYQALANAAIADIAARGQVPFLVGGSGLYVRAVLEGLTIPHVAPDQERRRELEAANSKALYDRLQQLDPTAAAKIDPRNKRRVIRAIEVCETTGTPISSQQNQAEPGYRVLRIGLTLPREELYRRINTRIDLMIGSGLVEEVQGLLSRGVAADAAAMSGLGYRQIELYLRGTVSLEEAIRLLKRDTRRFVHHQYSWFRLNDARIHWFDLTKSAYDEFHRLAAGYLAP